MIANETNIKESQIDVDLSPNNLSYRPSIMSKNQYNEN